MKVWIDKLLLAIGGLALVGGIAFWLLAAGDLPPARPNLPAAGAVAALEPVPVPEVEPTEAVWDPARPQDEAGLQLYQVFTPPKIYVNADGAFDFIPPREPRPPEPFGLRLLAVERELYRIQYEGFIEDPEDPSNSLILLYNTESGESHRVRKGESVAEAGITILDFTVIREIQEDGLLYKEERTRLRDDHLDTTLVLSSQQPERYTDERTIRIEDSLEGLGRSELGAVGESAVFGSRTYTLDAFDAAAGTATFTKEAPDQEEARTRQLSVAAPATATSDDADSEDAPPEGSTEPESSDDFPF